jgi:predicted enzyme related to lactoylglutathione lyase
MARVIGLGGVFFKSRDPQALGAWYAEWLDVPVQHPYGASFKPGRVPAGGYHVWSPFAADTDYFAPSQAPFMFNLMVDDLEGCLARVAAGGAEVMAKREKGDYGDFGWFIDPEGNKVELWQPPTDQPADVAGE